MSQHIFETEHDGGLRKVFAGWDRPLQGFYMTIENTTPDEDTDEVFIFNNLVLKDSHPTFEPFIHALVDLGLVIPKEMIDEIVADGKVDIGNKVVEHSNEGEYKRKQLY